MRENLLTVDQLIKDLKKTIKKWLWKSKYSFIKR